MVERLVASGKLVGKFPKRVLFWGIFSLTAFLLFLFQSLSLGGTAIGGKIEDGRTYVGVGEKVIAVGRLAYVCSALLSACWAVGFFFMIKELLDLIHRLKLFEMPRAMRVFMLLLFGLVSCFFGISSIICILRML